MEFNSLISKKLSVFFKNYNLQIIEEFKNYLKLKSDKIFIILTHDEREKSNALYVGRNENHMYPIDENVLKKAFDSDLKINNISQEEFVNNIAIFFEGKGRPLISGNVYAIEAVEKYVYLEGQLYTTELLNKQNLQAANKAWEQNNFKDFIRYLDNIEVRYLPSSYKIKYKMALRKLK